MAYIYWNANPILIQLGPVAIRWYGLLFAAGFYIGFMLVQWMFKIEKKDQSTLSNLLLYMIAGAVIGARLGHCLFYEPGYYLSHPLQIFKVWEGGLASHGGALGILLALWIYSRRYPGQPYLWVLDRVVVPTALAGALIRLGNVFNSEILGKPADLPWAFVFRRVDDIPRHPVQLYESASYLLIFCILLWLYRRYRQRTPHGLLLGAFLLLVFTARFILEFFKEPQAPYEANLPISVGQSLSIPFILLGLWLLLRARQQPPSTS